MDHPADQPGGATAKPRRRTRLRVRLAAVLFTLLLMFLAGEIAARIAFPVVHLTRHFRPGMFLADHDRGWIPKPGYSGIYAEFFSEVEVHVDGRGLRGAGRSPEDPAADLRVLCVGDSNTFGLGVGDDETWPAQLETGLRTGQRTCAVWNAGVVGYATNQERITLEKFAPALDPQAVVLGWLRNDVGEPQARPEIIDGYVVKDRKEYEEFRRDLENRRFYEASRLVTVLTLVSKFRRHRRRFEERAKQGALERDDPAQVERNVALVREMARTCRERGARFLVLAFEDQPQVETGTEHPIVARFIARMQVEGIETLSVGDVLRADFAAHGEPLFVRRDNIHLNARGHRLVAEAAARLLAPK